MYRDKEKQRQAVEYPSQEIIDEQHRILAEAYKRAEDKSGYLYIINCSDSTLYKIGITRSDISKRVKELQVGCPYKLIPVAIFYDDHPEVLEAKIHDLCRSVLVQGEWFDLSPAMFAKVIYKIMPLLWLHIPSEEDIEIANREEERLKVEYVPPKS